MEREDAYWISPTGEVVPVDSLMRNHINTVTQNPAKFGTTIDEIRAIHQDHNERMGMEGKAREEIMLNLMKKGWIRVRNRPRQDSWTIQLWSLRDNRAKDNIWDFVTKAVEEGIIGKYSAVKLMAVQDNQVHDSSAEKIIRGVVASKPRTFLDKVKEILRSS